MEPQIIQTLRAMKLVDRLGNLQNDEDDVFDESVTVYSICVFCVFCGSIFLVYRRHNLANSLPQQKPYPALGTA